MCAHRETRGGSFAGAQDDKHALRMTNTLAEDDKHNDHPGEPGEDGAVIAHSTDR